MTGASNGRIPWLNISADTTELKSASMAWKASGNLDVLAVSISHGRPVVGLVQDLQVLGRKNRRQWRWHHQLARRQPAS